MTLRSHHPCNLCAGHDVHVVGTRDRAGRPLRSVLCDGCGLVWSDPRPDDAVLDDYYAHDYRRDYKGVHAPRLRHVVRAGRVALDRFDRIRPLLLGRPRLLDVGAGGGEFLYGAVRLAGVLGHGLEPNASYAAHARAALGVSVDEGFVQSHKRPSASVDVVTMFHVLEHLADPQGALRRIADWLRPGGYAVVEVPNVEATCQAPAHTFHTAHLYTFGAATLERMGARAGLVPIVTRHSADGGNVEVVFVRQGEPAACGRPDALIPGNAERVRRILAGHRAVAHYARGRPLARLARRIAGQVSERRDAAIAPSPRAALDALIARYGAANGHLVALPAS
jgi:2-polyprenyl-3-methyl-5-hydroxy-6-metoxy-1,4-benzoquinol methylase